MAVCAAVALPLNRGRRSSLGGPRSPLLAFPAPFGRARRRRAGLRESGCRGLCPLRFYRLRAACNQRRLCAVAHMHGEGWHWQTPQAGSGWLNALVSHGGFATIPSRHDRPAATRLWGRGAGRACWNRPADGGRYFMPPAICRPDPTRTPFFAPLCQLLTPRRALRRLRRRNAASCWPATLCHVVPPWCL